MNKKREVLDELKNPETEYRPMNYWGWLEKIEPCEVEWQIDEMSKAGLGGYVMHARGGLLTPYMGEQWLDSVNAMVNQGKKLGMATVVDDEDGWPSGFGAGNVNGKGEEYWLKWLECEKVKPGELHTTACTIGVYILTDNMSFRIMDLSKVKETDDELIHIYYKSSKYYVDNLDPKVVREFIKVSYEVYYNSFSSEFGKGIKMIFTDEPQLARDHVTWSWILPEEFKKMYGYDLVEALPAIYFDIDGHEKIRYDFWKLLSSLFADSFSKQIGKWCSEHNVVFTGHTCYEDDLQHQMECSGSTMPFYEYMQIPGMDWLCRTPVNNMTVKQVTSVAQQLGKERILSEMFGCVGWNVSFEEMKWIAEWQYVLGINLMLQHLGLYSLRGTRKREYPASLFFQQPWWNEFKAFNDYFAKLSKLFSESEPVIDILVIHPIRSAWVAYNGFDNKRVYTIDDEFKKITQNLLSLNYDFHYGDEEIILRHGKVEGNEIIVGKFSYKAVIIPPSLSLDRNTVHLMEKLVKNKGVVISIGEYPCLVEGKPDTQIRSLMNHISRIDNAISQLDSALSKVLNKKIEISHCDGSVNDDIFCCTRKIKEETIYFIVNTNKEKSHEIQIRLANGRNVSRLNLSDCTEEKVKDLNCICLEPTESIILICKENCTKNAIDNTFDIPDNRVGETESEAQENIPLDGEWNLLQADNNAITLDYCQYSIDNGPWEGEIPVILLQEKLLLLGRPVDIALKFRFTLDYDIKSRLYLVIEEPERFSILINGKQLDCLDEGWWIDKSFRKMSIENLVQTNENEIVLKRHFYCSEKVYRIKNDKSIHEAESNRVTVETELEGIYLLGDFSVDMDGFIKNADRRAIFAGKSFKLTNLRKKVLVENLVTQGYPFFAGRIKLLKKFDLKGLDKNKANVELTFDRPDSIITKIYVNGKILKTFLWAPYSVDMTQFAREGENEIIVELVNSCRNLLGPHHHSGGELFDVGQHSYRDTSCWTDDYCLVRFGVSGLNVRIN